MKRRIHKITIENFQSHRKTEVELDEFTVIIGPTDSGKSAIIRAIRWCLFNDVDNLNFIREGEKFAEVTVEFADGGKIIRHRGATENSYKIQPVGGEEIFLTAFGSGTVPEVMQFHGMFEANLFGEPQNLNVSNQLEAPFFLAESPARKAMMIGQIANTDVIDLAIEKAAQDIRTEKTKEKLVRGDLKKTESELKTYDKLPLLRVELDRINKSLQNLIDLDQKSYNLNAHKTTLGTMGVRRNESLTKLALEGPVEQAVRDIGALEKRSASIRPLHAALSNLQINIKKNEGLRQVLVKAPEDQVERAASELEKALADVSKAKRTVSRLHTLKQLMISRDATIKNLRLEKEVELLTVKLGDCMDKLQSIKTLRLKLADLQAQYQRLQKGEQIIRDLSGQYSRALQSYKDALAQSPICPVCQSEITTEKLAKIAI